MIIFKCRHIVALYQEVHVLHFHHSYNYSKMEEAEIRIIEEVSAMEYSLQNINDSDRYQLAINSMIHIESAEAWEHSFILVFQILSELHLIEDAW
jgi:hypothetical protein